MNNAFPFSPLTPTKYPSKSYLMGPPEPPVEPQLPAVAWSAAGLIGDGLSTLDLGTCPDGFASGVSSATPLAGLHPVAPPRRPRPPHCPTTEGPDPCALVAHPACDSPIPPDVGAPWRSNTPSSSFPPNTALRVNIPFLKNS